MQVASRFKRRRLASRLMRALEAHAAAHGCASLSLTTACSGAAAFYARQGYATVENSVRANSAPHLAMHSS